MFIVCGISLLFSSNAKVKVYLHFFARFVMRIGKNTCLHMKLFILNVYPNDCKQMAQETFQKWFPRKIIDTHYRSCQWLLDCLNCIQ